MSLTADVNTTAKISDLLSESQVSYTSAAANFIKDKAVLVTGAGGSIGSELVVQLTDLGARKIISVDRDEYALYRLELKLKGNSLLTDEEYVLCDIQNFGALESVFKTFRPDIVFHAAAYKHLPLLEKSPRNGISTNIAGSENVAKLSALYGCECMVNISTDKAASPISVLGLTKRFAEILTTSYANPDTRISSVRFGNVFNSRGSFIETLKWQIKRGLQVTITDENVARYFMTIPDAVSLVIESSVFAKSGQTYVLDMGQPIKIVDAAREIAATSDAKISFKFVGLRKNEKMQEVLYDSHEEWSKTSNPRISYIKSRLSAKLASETQELARRLRNIADNWELQDEEIAKELKTVVNSSIKSEEELNK